MPKHKKPREKGRFSFTRYFQVFKTGDSVAVARELSIIFGYPKRLQGKTGKVLSKQGAAYKVEIKDIGQPKRYLIKPVHLKKIEAQ